MDRSGRRARRPGTAIRAWRAVRYARTTAKAWWPVVGEPRLWKTRARSLEAPRCLWRRWRDRARPFLQYCPSSPSRGDDSGRLAVRRLNGQDVAVQNRASGGRLWRRSTRRRPRRGTRCGCRRRPGPDDAWPTPPIMPRPPATQAHDPGHAHRNLDVPRRNRTAGVQARVFRHSGRGCRARHRPGCDA